jgi:diguanylate cyclase (GGDEF)-like protein
MHPPTVVLMLAVHLIGMGALFLYAARRLPGQRTVLPWACGSLGFGLAYLARLAAGLREPPDHTVWIDALLVLSELMLLAGVRELLGGGRRLRTACAIAVMFLGVQGALTFGFGAVTRFAVLNAVMAALYVAIGATSLQGIARVGRGSGLRPPLAVFGTLMTLLGVLTGVRGILVLSDGIASMYEGWFAGAFFAYGSVVSVLVAVILVWIVFARLSETLHHMARHDALTGALNRHGLLQALERHFAPESRPAMVLMAVDVDHFKAINDEHGHAVGDAVLRAIARSLLAHCRSEDIVARTGGEEFLVGYAADDPRQALDIAERIRSAVAAIRIRGRFDGDVRCTVSIGLSRTFVRLDEWERAAIEADRALYAAKAKGRDRVVGDDDAPGLGPVNAIRSLAPAA